MSLGTAASRSTLSWLCRTQRGGRYYGRLRPLPYADTDVILVCFSIDFRGSLENIPEKWTLEGRLILRPSFLRNDLHTLPDPVMAKQKHAAPEDGLPIPGEKYRCPRPTWNVLPRPITVLARRSRL
ncbi:hypothetical protein HPB50_014555 [Hyalomma asiaticum]|uniref:Uncharacterized protein n=1 Tax=Hyalomma asiaticum TaxID=266040 RepID=A0ACB7TI97_HYAAI|nr:hypothetical protein HPB50_014555 [Hyalomma asiaticum]